MSMNAWRRLAIALFLALLVLLAYRLAPRPEAQSRPALAAMRCDPGLQPCSAALPGGGQLTLMITPGPIKALQPLELRVTISGQAASALAVEFTGRDMEMGSHRSPLADVDGQFVGQGMLPVCVTARMEWVASVLVVSADRELKEFAVPFHFSVSARPGVTP